MRAISVAAVLAGGVSAAMLVGIDTHGSAEAQDTDDSPDKDEVRPVRTTRVETGPISTYVDATTNLVAEHQVQIVAEVAGRLTRLPFEEGDQVRAGQLVAALSSGDARLSLQTARIKTAAADLTLDRVKQLQRQQLVSPEELEKAQTEHDVAKQEIAEAKWRLGQAQIRSPVAGRVTERFVVPGQWVNVGQELYQVTDLDHLVARIHVPERDALEIDVGRPVHLALQADPSIEFEGKVRHVASVVEIESGTVKITIEVASAPEKVRSGSFVDVRLVRTHHEQATLVHREAVLRSGDQPHVFVVEDGIARRREIEVGTSAGGRTEITDGLQSGDTVVLEGHGNLGDGDRVEVLEAESP